MSIAQRFVEAMGGRITVHSEVGKGSEFAFEISCRSANSSTIESTTETAASVNINQPTSLVGGTTQLQQLKILLVEDNPVNIDYALRQVDAIVIVY